jgi:hypothetical protein
LGRAFARFDDAALALVANARRDAGFRRFDGGLSVAKLRCRISMRFTTF